MKITAVVPAKGESQRLENKNLKQLGGVSLVELACEKLLKSKYIDDAYIDTESERIISEVQHLFSKGLKLIQRPKELATNSIGGNEMFVYSLHSVQETDILIHHYCTSPLIKPSTIDKVIGKFVNNMNENDSFLTVVEDKGYYWSREGDPINFETDTLPNSQELEGKYKETHGIYGIMTESLIDHQTRLGDNPMLVPIPKRESFDIDTEEDMHIVRNIFRGRK
jgi:CMP-N-acetylneuraminic acid synthetase